MHTHTNRSVSIASFSLVRLNIGKKVLLGWQSGDVECLRVSVHVCACSRKVENEFLCCQLHLVQPVVISLAAGLLVGVSANKINLRPKGNWHFQLEDKSICRTGQMKEYEQLSERDYKKGESDGTTRSGGQESKIDLALIIILVHKNAYGMSAV